MLNYVFSAPAAVWRFLDKSWTGSVAAHVTWSGAFDCRKTRKHVATAVKVHRYLQEPNRSDRFSGCRSGSVDWPRCLWTRSCFSILGHLFCGFREGSVHKQELTRAQVQGLTFKPVQLKLLLWSLTPVPFSCSGVNMSSSLQRKIPKLLDKELIFTYTHKNLWAPSECTHSCRLSVWVLHAARKDAPLPPKPQKRSALRLDLSVIEGQL